MALFSRIHVWVSNEILTASDLNNEFNNLLNNSVASSIVGASADVASMQSTADPGGVGTESLASSVSGELQRLRFAIKRIINQAQWYVAPVGSLSTGGISTAALADGAVTQVKRAALGQSLSSSCGSFNTTSITYADVTNLSVSFTSSGRPVFIGLVNDGATSDGLQVSRNAAVAEGFIKLFRDATGIKESVIIGANEVGSTFSEIGVPTSSFWHVDVVAAGTYTYKVQARVGFGSNSEVFIVGNSKLLVFEL